MTDAEAYDNLGEAVAGIGDVDGDGVPDLVAGAPNDGTSHGAVYIMLLSSSGTARQVVKLGEGLPLAPYDFFGSSVAALGDVDGDGTPDIAVGAWGEDGTGGSATGALYILFLLRNGSRKSDYVVIDNSSAADVPLSLIPFSEFGKSIAYLGSGSQGGTMRLAVGAPGVPPSGTVYLLDLQVSSSYRRALSSSRLHRRADSSPPLPSVTPWQLLHSRTLAPTASTVAMRFGSSLAHLSDGQTSTSREPWVNLAIGAPGVSSTTAQGAVYLASTGQGGGLLYTIGSPLPTNGDAFGSAVASGVDWNSDGIADLVVGAELGQPSLAALFCHAVQPLPCRAVQPLLCRAVQPLPCRAAQCLRLLCAHFCRQSSRIFTAGAPFTSLGGALFLLFLPATLARETGDPPQHLQACHLAFYIELLLACTAIQHQTTATVPCYTRTCHTRTCHTHTEYMLYAPLLWCCIQALDMAVPGAHARITAAAAGLPVNAEFGQSVSLLGSVDGDLVPDLAAGARTIAGAPPGAGAVAVLRMTATSFPARPPLLPLPAAPPTGPPLPPLPPPLLPPMSPPAPPLQLQSVSSAITAAPDTVQAYHAVLGVLLIMAASAFVYVFAVRKHSPAGISAVVVSRVNGVVNFIYSSYADPMFDVPIKSDVRLEIRKARFVADTGLSQTARKRQPNDAAGVANCEEGPSVQPVQKWFVSDSRLEIRKARSIAETGLSQTARWGQPDDDTGVVNREGPPMQQWCCKRSSDAAQSGMQ